MEIRPILSALLRSKTGAAAGRDPGRPQPGDPRQRALHRAAAPAAPPARPSGVADEARVVYVRVRPLRASAPHERRCSLAASAMPKALRARAGRGIGGAGPSRCRCPARGINSGVASTDASSAGQRQRRDCTSRPGFAGQDAGPEAGRRPRLQRRDEVIEIDPRHRTPRTAQARTSIITRALARSCIPDASSYVGKTFYFGTGAGAARAHRRRGRAPAVSRRRRAGERGEYSADPAVAHRRCHASRFVIRAEPGPARPRDAGRRGGDAQASPAPVRMQHARRSTRTAATATATSARMAWMLVAVSALLLLVTASGIVGLASFWVQQRRADRRAPRARRDARATSCATSQPRTSSSRRSASCSAWCWRYGVNLC